VAKGSVAREVRKVRLSEIQAIAIYEAEVFWIRASERKEVLERILAEEKHHDAGMAAYSDVSPLLAFLSKIAGWLLGSVLAGLPWSWMCRVQAAAEREAAKIYRGAAAEIRRIEPSHPGLIHELEQAETQEEGHAREFDTLADSLIRGRQ
jgi:rubrerythrin